MNEIQRSIYSLNQQYEEESRTHIKYIFNKIDWKFRDLNQDNDIDGELEIFDPVNGGEEKQTSGKFIKVQIKSTKECKISLPYYPTLHQNALINTFVKFWGLGMREYFLKGDNTTFLKAIESKTY